MHVIGWWNENKGRVAVLRQFCRGHFPRTPDERVARFNHVWVINRRIDVALGVFGYRSKYEPINQRECIFALNEGIVAIFVSYLTSYKKGLRNLK